MNRDGFDLRRARRALNELVRRSTSADVKSSDEGVLGMMTGKDQNNILRKKNVFLPPSLSKYKFRLSAFSRIRSLSSLSLPATSLVTALTTSSVRPCSTRL
jgi:hypothetical protein